METTKAKRNRWRNLCFFPNSVRLRGLAHGNQQSKHKSFEKSWFFFFKIPCAPQGSPMEASKAKRNPEISFQPRPQTHREQLFGKRSFLLGKSWDFSRFRAPQRLANGDHQSKKKSLEKSRIFSEFRAPPRARPWKPAEQTQIVGDILDFFLQNPVRPPGLAHGGQQNKKKS